MTAELVAQLTVLVLAAFVGFEVISKVPTTLHTPLMSGDERHPRDRHRGRDRGRRRHRLDLVKVLGTIAIAFGAINVVGGFLVTDRMLHMFKRRPGERGDG